MDNRINDMATPGCSHWAPLPVAEAYPALPSLQNLSGVRNTVQNIRPLSHLVQATVEPLYLTPPPSGYIASEQVVANQLHSLVMSMEQLPSADALAQATGVSENIACDALNAVYASSGSLPESMNEETERYMQMTIEQNRIAMLRQCFSRLNNESNEDYAHRLFIKRQDIATVSALTGLALGRVKHLRRILPAELDGRAKRVRQVYPRLPGESNVSYVRRLVQNHQHIDVIAAVSGELHRYIRLEEWKLATEREGRVHQLKLEHPRRPGESNADYSYRLAMSSEDASSIAVICELPLVNIKRLMRSVESIKNGKAESLSKTYPQKNGENNNNYAFRLCLYSRDIKTISAVTGISLNDMYGIRGAARAEKDGRADTLRHMYPRRDREHRMEYAHRLISFTQDDKAVSAASGIALWKVRQLIRNREVT